MGAMIYECTLTFDWLPSASYPSAQLRTRVRERFETALKQVLLSDQIADPAKSNPIYEYLVARTNSTFRAFGHDLHIISYKEREGSFEVTFIIMAVMAFNTVFGGYGSIRQSIDYFIKDIELLEKTFERADQVKMQIKTSPERPVVFASKFAGFPALGFISLGVMLLFGTLMWFASQEATRITNSLDTLGKRFEESTKSLEKSNEALQTKITDLSVRPYNISVPDFERNKDGNRPRVNRRR